MRIRFHLQVAFTLSLLTLSTPLWAQFQEPTQEELKMTAEPKAPGAAAIYLYREETVDDNLHYHGFHARIKVLTEKGKELATVSIPYLKSGYTLTDVRARTIHADGTVIPLDVKPTDLVEHKEGTFQVNKLVFTLPNAEVGSILEYSYQLRYPDESLSSPEWEIQQPFYVRKAHYSFSPYKYMERVTSGDESASHLLFSTMLPESAKLQHDPTYSRYWLDIMDVPPVPQEEYQPPIGAFMQHVTFYYSPYVSQDDFWKSRGTHWSKEIDHFANESKGLKEAVAGIVAAGDSEDVKAHKLYDAVMVLDNTDYTRSKSKAELKQMHMKAATDAEEVWKQKSGSSDNLTLLYLAMLRIAGIKAYAMLVCDRDKEIFNPYYLNMNQFDSLMVTATINGKEMALDPGKKSARFGELSWKHTLVAGLHQTDKEVVFGQTPNNSYKEASTLRIADLTIAKDGSVKGTVRIAMNGPAATRWRELAIENDEDEVKKQFNEEMRDMVPEGVNADFDHFLGLEDYHTQLMGVVNISGNIGTVTGKRVFLPGLFFASRAKHPFVADEKRETSVDMHYADIVQDEVTYHLPESFTMESAPADTSVPWVGHAAFAIKAHPQKDQIMVSRQMVRGFTLVPPKDYPDLRGFYQKVATADQQQLVLTAAPATASGN